MAWISTRSCLHVNISTWTFNLSGRDKLFHYARENLNSKIVDEKLDHFFNNFKCAAEVNLAFGFILKNIEDGGFKHFNAQENTLLDRTKLVCTQDDLAKL